MERHLEVPGGCFDRLKVSERASGTISAVKLKRRLVTYSFQEITLKVSETINAQRLVPRQRRFLGSLVNAISVLILKRVLPSKVLIKGGLI